MKGKTTSTKFSRILKLLKTKELRIPLIILLIGALVSTLIITAINGGLPRVSITIPSPARLFAWYKYGQVKDIQNYSELNSIFASQPKITVWRDKKYYLVENCDLNDTSCKKFHYSGTESKKSNFDSLLSDFVTSGKVTYTWLDYLAAGALTTNNSLYCIAEQNASLFSDFITEIGKESSSFDKDKAKNYVRNHKLNLSKFEDCYDKNTYKSRIEQLNQISTTLGTTASPTFYLFKEGESNIRNLDGVVEKKKIYTLKLRLDTNKSYDGMRVELLNALK